MDDFSSAFSRSDIVNWSAGGHVLYHLKDGSLWALGSNLDGQLGDGTNIDRLNPVQVLESITTSNALSLVEYPTSAGFSHSGISRKTW